MPSFPFHGWMPDGYMQMPIAPLAVFTAILSKVAAYGFLQIALPLFPHAAVKYQELLLLVALASILYGSAMAFTTTQARLVLGYSSVAQLGFIVLGIFSLDARGADGALLQSVNHAIVAGPLIFVVALLAARSGGSEDLRDMGGIATKAPAFAAVFLVFTFALLAMPGTSNFVGEFMILLGVFQAKTAIAIIASVGVVMAAVYALRLYIRAMHNRVGPLVQARELTVRDGLVLVPMLLAVVALALYPQFALKRGEHAVAGSLAAAKLSQKQQQVVAETAGRTGRHTMSPLLAVARAHAPHIDWAGLSPLLALLGGATVVLLAGLLRPRAARHHLVPFLSVVSFGAAIGCAIWQWDERGSLIEGALALDPLTLLVVLIVGVAGIATTLLAWRDQAAREVAHGEFFALLLTSAAGMVVLGAAQNLVSTFVGLELLSLPLYILCASLVRRESSLESGLKYLIIGSVGSATLLYGFALIYGATGATDYATIARQLVRKGLSGDVLVLTGIGMTIVGLAFKASLAPFHQWTPDVYEGAPTPVTGYMSVATKIAAFAVIIRLFDVALLPAVDDWRPVWIAIAVISILVGNVGALGQSSLKRMLAYSSIAQAGYILAGFVVVTQLGIQAVLFYLAAYLLANMAAFAVVTLRERETGGGRRPRRDARARRPAPRRGARDDAVDAEPRRDPGHGRLHGQVPADRGDRGRRLHLARHRDRDRLDDLARVLPAGGRDDVA